VYICKYECTYLYIFTYINVYIYACIQIYVACKKKFKSTSSQKHVGRVKEDLFLSKKREILCVSIFEKSVCHSTHFSDKIENRTSISYEH